MILVTGASGLVGRELMHQLLGQGLAARGTDRAMTEDPSIEAGDLRDAATCRRLCKGADTVVHAAAVQHHSGMPRWGRRAFFNENVTMTRNLVDAAVACGLRHIVFVSSDMVYGLPPGRPLIESDETLPIGPYGESKLASERICLAARSSQLAVTILRPRLIIGPGRLGVLQRLFDRVRRGRSVPIFGRGNHRYQMVAVSDVAAACVLAARNRSEGVFNLGSSDPPTVRSLMTDLCRRADSPSRVISLPRVPARLALWTLHGVRLAPLTPEQFRIADVDYVLDTTAAQRALGWIPRFADSDMMWSAYETYITEKGLDRSRSIGSSAEGHAGHVKPDRIDRTTGEIAARPLATPQGHATGR